jgi:Protein of unknown function (DUF1153)
VRGKPTETARPTAVVNHRHALATAAAGREQHWEKPLQDNNIQMGYPAMDASAAHPPQTDDADVAAEATATAVDDLGDLPAVDTRRWVASRKAAVLVAIADGRLTRAAACARYRISEAELRLWERAVECAGVPGLRVTRVQIYREVFEGRRST